MDRLPAQAILAGRIAAIRALGLCQHPALPTIIIGAPFGARHPSGAVRRALPPVPADAAKTV